MIISGQFWNGRGKKGRDLFEVAFRHLPGGKGKNYNSQIPTRNSKRASSEYKSVKLSGYTKCCVLCNVERVEANKCLTGADYITRKGREINEGTGTIHVKVQVKVKGKVHPITGHEDPEAE
jgi:hypothetical protein